MTVGVAGSAEEGGQAGDAAPPAPAPVSWKPMPSPAVVAFPLDDELVLHDSRGGEVYVLNRTAALVWRMCDGSTTAAAMAQALSAAFGVGHDEALCDVLDLAEDLRRAGLLSGG